MNAQEFSKKGFLSTKYALGVTIAVEGEKTIESEFRLAKEAILGWAGDRGRSADLIIITVLAAEEALAAIEQFVINVARYEAQLAPLFRKVRGELNLLNLKGQSKKTIPLP